MNVRLETKVRVLAVLHILIRRGAATTREIQEELSVRYNIQANRQTIYDDIQAINQLHPVAYDGYAGGWAYRIKKTRAKPGGERKNDAK